MSFEQNIQQWVSIDNQIRLLNDKIHELREKKHNLCENITSHVENNNLRNATVQISDGKLKFVTTKVAAPLTSVVCKLALCFQQVCRGGM